MNDGGAGITYQIGIAAQHRGATVELYDAAFGRKLAAAIKDPRRRRRLLEDGFMLSHAVAALRGDELLGIAGFKDRHGALTGGIGAGDLFSLGLWQGMRALLVFMLYERAPAAGEMVMDGIAVRADARGGGIGSGLLAALVRHAADSGFSQVRLDVIDGNPAAKRLYERFGFVEVEHSSFGFLRPLLGFGGAATMVFEIEGG